MDYASISVITNYGNVAGITNKGDGKQGLVVLLEIRISISELLVIMYKLIDYINV